jgi:taurine dioxygenase
MLGVGSRRTLRRLTTAALTPHVGVVVGGLDLRSGQAAKIVHAAVTAHGVCFVRDGGEDDAIVALARELGALEGPHPLYSPDPTSPLAVVAHDADSPPDGAEWHTDCSWSSAPPAFSLLWPKVLPGNGGGDTLWLSSCAAFDALPAGMQSDLRGLKAVHDMGSFRNGYARAGGADAINAGHADFGCAIWPVVTTHPVTRRECLFVNETFTVQVEGLMADQSRRLLAYLFSHLQRPEFQCRWKWKLGDLAVWDNRSTQHYACADYAGLERRMHRVTVVNDRIGDSMTQ